MATISIAEISPKLPMFSAMILSLAYKGVSVSSFYLSKALILPTLELSPTTMITIFPSPVRILVPLSITHEGTEWRPAVFLLPSAISLFLVSMHWSKLPFFTGSVSPVIADSSVVSSVASRTNPSAGISWPS